MPYRHKEDQRAYARQHYYQNRERYLEQIRRHKVRVKKELREEVQRIKETRPCADCNKYFPYYIMDFDHIEENKVTNVAKLVSQGQRKRALAEIEKCELVCANCHRQRTWERLLVRSLEVKVSVS